MIPMNDTFASRVAGVFVLLSLSAEFAAVGISYGHGGPAVVNSLNFGSGSLLGNVFRILDFTSFIVLFAVGVPLIAVAMIRARDLPSWLGWALLVPTLLVGYVAAPLLLLGRAVGGPFMGVGLNVFFVCFLV